MLKKNINPLCFYVVPNIIIKVVTKASFLNYKNMLSFKERENGKIHYSINSKDFTYPGKYGYSTRNIRSCPGSSVSFITLKEKGKENGGWTL